MSIPKEIAYTFETPIGLMPHYVFDDFIKRDLEYLKVGYLKEVLPQRIISIKEAIERYMNVDKAIPIKWVEEYNERIKDLEDLINEEEK